MSSRTRVERNQVLLGLADTADSDPVVTQWVGTLVALGARLARSLEDFGGRQLIVAISVPTRQFAATLVGVGWTLSRPPRTEDVDPLVVLREAQPHEHFRAVNASDVISGKFLGLDESHDKPRVRLAGTWSLEHLRALARVAAPDPAERMKRPELGSLGRMTGIDRDWDRRLVAPAADLAIIGTKSWIQDDLSAFIARGEDPDGEPLETLLLPLGNDSATWFTRIYSSAKLTEQLPLPDDVVLSILDGYGAIKYLNEVTSPIVVCVVDRSVADESAAELLLEARLANSRGISLLRDIGWSPPRGVESLGFTVAL